MMRRKVQYLLYKAFQSAKLQNNTQTYCVFIVFLQCLRTQRKHFFHLHRKNQQQVLWYKMKSLLRTCQRQLLT